MSSYTFAPFDPTPIYLGGVKAVSRPITIASGANAAGTVLPRGTVLGIVTSSGNFQTSVVAATDGSQVPRCILADDVDASTGTVSVSAYFTGEFATQYLNYGAGHSITTVNAAFILSGQNIFIKDVGTVI